MDIKETKEAVIGVAKFYKLGKEVMADGKINLADFPVIVGAAPSIFASSKLGIEGADKIPGEIKDFSAEEAGELLLAVKSEFGLSDDEKALPIIAASLKLISAGSELAKAL